MCAIVKILKDGETDMESTDIWRFCFNSAYPTFKIGFQGNTTLTTTVAGGLGYLKTVTIAHNLGYVPQTFVFADYSAYPLYEGGYGKVEDVTGYYQFYYNDSLIQVEQSADETNIYFTISTPEYGKVLKFYYIICIDEA